MMLANACHKLLHDGMMRTREGGPAWQLLLQLEGIRRAAEHHHEGQRGGLPTCSRTYRQAPTLPFVMMLSRTPDAFKLEKKLPSWPTLSGPHHAIMQELMASIGKHHQPSPLRYLFVDGRRSAGWVNRLPS